MAMLWGDANLLLSRLFLYYQERVLDGDVDQDAGANMRDIGQVLNTIGCCLDTFFPYDPSKFSESPNKDAVANATNYRIQSYHSVPDLDGIKQVLALQQNPVLMGMDVYAGLESDSTAQTGIVPMPDSNEQSIGGHAVLVVGYIDSTLGRTLLQRQRNVLIVRNSWGESWGDKGYFYLPYDYVSKYAYDCWVLVK
jgi:C1A family cysteine protease